MIQNSVDYYAMLFKEPSHWNSHFFNRTGVFTRCRCDPGSPYLTGGIDNYGSTVFIEDRYLRIREILDPISLSKLF